MPLLKDGRLVEDGWTLLSDEDSLEASSGDVIVSLERWRRDGDRLRRHHGRLGLRLRSDQSTADIDGELGVFALFALEFPRFGDGRAYSAARLLRERYAFEGEIRAVGEVLRDQFFFMHRCGFNAFEVAERDAAAWHEALSEVTVWYQPATVGGTHPLAARPAPERAANPVR